MSQDEPSSIIRPGSPTETSSTTRELRLLWSGHQKWLEECGYTLRPRGWVPSWQGTTKRWYLCEDGQHGYDKAWSSHGCYPHKFVMLKVIQKSIHPYEVDIGLMFSSPPLAGDPNNHCIPIYQVLQVPDDEDSAILVMPLLREYNDPRFDTVGEVIECFSQIFEGLKFMHKYHVAHRDCMNLNIMMDALPLYPVPFHPRIPYMRRDFKGRAKHKTRIQKPVRYYFIDFGLSRRYEPDTVPLEDPIWGGDKTVPEFQTSNEACNPFPTDVYYIGNLIRRDFIEGSEFTSGVCGFEFMKDLVTDMTQDDPKRPNMDEVVARFEEIRKGLSSWKLRSRIVKRGDHPIPGIFRFFSHWTRRIGFILRRVQAIPSP